MGRILWFQTHTSIPGLSDTIEFGGVVLYYGVSNSHEHPRSFRPYDPFHTDGQNSVVSNSHEHPRSFRPTITLPTLKGTGGFKLTRASPVFQTQLSLGGWFYIMVFQTHTSIPGLSDPEYSAGSGVLPRRFKLTRASPVFQTTITGSTSPCGRMVSNSHEHPRSFRPRKGSGCAEPTAQCFKLTRASPVFQTQMVLRLAVAGFDGFKLTRASPVFQTLPGHQLGSCRVSSFKLTRASPVFQTPI
jgi:hypothetical protein